MPAPQRHRIKRNDTLPTIVFTVTDENGEALDLTGCGAVFLMYTDDTVRTEVVNEDAVITSPETDGVVAYGWSGDDTATAGEFLAEVSITFPDGGVMTFPQEGFVHVTIAADLDDA